MPDRKFACFVGIILFGSALFAAAYAYSVDYARVLSKHQGLDGLAAMMDRDSAPVAEGRARLGRGQIPR